MSDWRDPILKHFVPGVRQVTAVSDADGLLRDPALIREIEQRGFTLEQFEDSVSFRFDYETRFRTRWDAGETLEVVVVFRPGERDFDVLPADVLARARRLSFTLNDVFPMLSYGVVSTLESVHYDALYPAQTACAGHPLGERLTREFILQHVFHLVPSIVTKVPDLLRLLCQKHYSKMVLPEGLNRHLVDVLRQEPAFADWPLEILVCGRQAFWEFLDERWPVFVRESRGGTARIRESAETLKYPGPSLLPFDHDNVRIFVDNLFEDGILHPTAWNWEEAAPETWIRVGLVGRGAENAELRFEELTKQLVPTCPDEYATPQAWTAFASRYAQARLLWTKIGARAREKDVGGFASLCREVNERFHSWLEVGYAGMFNYPAVTPLMVHHLPPHLAHCLHKGSAKKVALIVFDGLAIEQWLAVKEELWRQKYTRTFLDDTLFAWVPSMTPISRQAVFSGKVPRYFPESIARTDRDEARWRQFWADHGFSPAEVGFTSVNGDPSDNLEVGKIAQSDLRVVGLTVMKVDKIMHGMQLGSTGMINQVQAWVEEGFVRHLFEQLTEAGFDVFVTADHGNLEAVGAGVLQEGVLSDTRGQRCRIYSEPVLRANALNKTDFAAPWDNPGLPPTFYPLLATYGHAFTAAGDVIVCHGGASLEEVMVPFARLEAVRPNP